MAGETNAQLTAKIDEMETTIDAEHQQYAQVVGGMNDEITTLREQLAAGDGATQQELAAHIGRLETLRGKLAAIVPDAAEPLPEEPPV